MSILQTVGGLRNPGKEMFKWQKMSKKQYQKSWGQPGHLLHPPSEDRIGSYDIPGRRLSSLAFKMFPYNLSTQTGGRLVLTVGKFFS